MSINNNYSHFPPLQPGSHNRTNTNNKWRHLADTEKLLGMKPNTLCWKDRGLTPKGRETLQIYLAGIAGKPPQAVSDFIELYNKGAYGNNHAQFSSTSVRSVNPELPPVPAPGREQNQDPLILLAKVSTGNKVMSDATDYPRPEIRSADPLTGGSIQPQKSPAEAISKQTPIFDYIRNYQTPGIRCTDLPGFGMQFYKVEAMNIPRLSNALAGEGTIIIDAGHMNTVKGKDGKPVLDLGAKYTFGDGRTMYEAEINRLNALKFAELLYQHGARNIILTFPPEKNSESIAKEDTVPRARNRGEALAALTSERPDSKLFSFHTNSDKKDISTGYEVFMPPAQHASSWKEFSGRIRDTLKESEFPELDSKVLHGNGDYAVYRGFQGSAYLLELGYKKDLEKQLAANSPKAFDTVVSAFFTGFFPETDQMLLAAKLTNL